MRAFTAAIASEGASPLADAERVARWRSGEAIDLGL
jgi:hypothetical protein